MFCYVIYTEYYNEYVLEYADLVILTLFKIISVHLDEFWRLNYSDNSCSNILILSNNINIKYSKLRFVYIYNFSLHIISILYNKLWGYYIRV